MPKWTEEQQQAIEARNHTILVSAAAGSGKTAVLIERIVSLVREGFRLNRMLIVTFTKAAAGEMRQRLKERLTKEAISDPQKMGEALDDLEATDISTIHAFCQRVIRTDFQAVGIDPMVRVCDDQQKKVLFEGAFREAMNDLLDARDPDADFMALADAFSQRELADMTAALYPFLMAMPSPFQWMEKTIGEGDGEDMRAQLWYRTLMERMRLETNGLEQYMQAMERMFEEPDAVDALRVTLERDRETVGYILDAASRDSNEDLLAALASASFVTAARTTKLSEAEKQWKDRYYKARKELKDAVTKNSRSLELDEDQTMADMTKIRSFLRGLLALVRRVHGCFIVAKNQQNVIDFSDMEQLTLEILQQPAFREKLQQDYDHIFVDECQDVSAVQDAIVQLIHGPESCLFMVGDVKQSIYRFRLADPTLFLNRMRTFSDAPDAPERRIFLQKNFRSRNNVLDATNRVFRSAMQRQVTELDYMREDELIAGRTTADDPRVEVRITRVSDEGRTAERELEAETAVVVRRIRELLDDTMQDGDTLRNYRYKDMVILLSKTAGIGARLAELLEEAGIPVYFDGKDDYFGLPEIRNVKAMLSVVDNQMQDLPLLTALKMIPFSMTESELARVRTVRGGKDVPFHEAFDAACEEEDATGARCRAIRERLREWRFLKETMRLSDFVWHVMRDSGYYAACGASPEGELRQANLRLFCQKAAEYEANFDGTLSGFLGMIDQQVSGEESKSAKVLGEGENLVRIMTMHKSKGLEFPVVFCMRLNLDIRKGAQGVLQMHNRLGLCLPYVNPDLSIRRDTAAKDAFRFRRDLDEMAERCRLLYVAMTRSREVLVMTGCLRKEPPMNWTMPGSAFRVWDADSMLDWVMQAVLDEADASQLLSEGTVSVGPWQVTMEEETSVSAQETACRAEETAEWVRQVVSVPCEEGMFDWWQTIGRRPASRPIKTSVSSLTRQDVLHDPMPMTDADETVDDKRTGEDIIAPLRMSELPPHPAFMEKKVVTGAERGTVMHHMLSLIDLGAIRGLAQGPMDRELRREAERMVDSGILTAEEAALISIGQTEAWFRSELGQRMLASDEVRREWSFNLRVSRKDGTLLQGVIDCVFAEDGKWVLVDYKTDRIEDESAFVERHQLQLNWYARALEAITGRKVGEMWLYSLGRQRAYPVPRLSIPDVE